MKSSDAEKQCHHSRRDTVSLGSCCLSEGGADRLVLHQRESGREASAVVAVSAMTAMVLDGGAHPPVMGSNRWL